MESISTDSRFAGHSTSHMDIVTTCWIQLEQISTSKPTSSILVPNTCAESLLLVERCSTTGPMTKNKSPFFFLLKYFYHEHRHVCEHTSTVCLRVTCFSTVRGNAAPLWLQTVIAGINKAEELSAEGTVLCCTVPGCNT